MSLSATYRVSGALLASVLLGIAGCGGGEGGMSSGSNPTGNSPPEEIQGVATPSSVAVVTATNAD